MRRSPFQVALLAGDNSYLPELLHQDNEAWARRSCFQVAGKAILVSEVFLKDFPQWKSATPLHRSRRGQVSATIGRSRS
jgi:chorismate--pyruvate lyase